MMDIRGCLFKSGIRLGMSLLSCELLSNRYSNKQLHLVMASILQTPHRNDLFVHFVLAT